MQDNARPHVAGVCQQFLQDEGIEAMDWSARSPVLNPIKHIWDIISHTIHQRHVAPQTVQELVDALVQVWRRSLRRPAAASSGACPGFIGRMTYSFQRHHLFYHMINFKTGKIFILSLTLSSMLFSPSQTVLHVIPSLRLSSTLFSPSQTVLHVIFSLTDCAPCYSLPHTLSSMLFFPSHTVLHVIFSLTHCPPCYSLPHRLSSILRMPCFTCMESSFDRMFTSQQNLLNASTTPQINSWPFICLIENDITKGLPTPVHEIALESIAPSTCYTHLSRSTAVSSPSSALTVQRVARTNRDDLSVTAEDAEKGANGGTGSRIHRVLIYSITDFTLHRTELPAFLRDTDAYFSQVTLMVRLDAARVPEHFSARSSLIFRANTLIQRLTLETPLSIVTTPGATGWKRRVLKVVGLFYGGFDPPGKGSFGSWQTLAAAFRKKEKRIRPPEGRSPRHIYTLCPDKVKRMQSLLHSMNPNRRKGRQRNFLIEVEAGHNLRKEGWDRTEDYLVLVKNQKGPSAGELSDQIPCVTR
ncbi:unnamed protein product [Ranitomeya imitator]|uniref:Transposase n=1 Tax=Ranitomeya imitator TaxID=111125 RepID=A0ABN9L9Z0_9NEOB|nr:unnamed protein product [Ranitomeya imitator]